MRRLLRRYTSLGRAIKLCKFAISSIYAIPLIAVARLLKPLIVIRFGDFRADRIGHYAANVGQRFAEQEDLGKEVHVYWIDKNTSNSFWTTLARRNFYVARWVYYVQKWNKLVPGGKANHLEATYTRSRDIHGIREKKWRFMSFTDIEDEIAKNWLRSHGWKDGEPFVTLQVRDDKYLACNPLHGKGREEDYKRWSYHAYRNSDIDLYVEASEWLADNGVWVIRMGRDTFKKMRSGKGRIIDYSHSDAKSDLLDVWLFAHTDLCITTGTGPDAISDVYRRPLLFINYVPTSDAWTWSDVHCAPKPLYWKSNGCGLDFRELVEHEYHYGNMYEERGIGIRNLTSKDILEITKEAWAKQDGGDLDCSSATEALINKLFEIDKNKDKNNWIHPRFSVSPYFYQKYIEGINSAKLKRDIY